MNLGKRSSLAGTCTLIASLVVVALAAPSSALGGGAPGGDGSGGRAVAHYAGGKKAPAGKTPDARLAQVGMPAIEPTIGVDKKGVLYMTVIGAGLSPDVVRSKDDGRSWEVASPQVAGRKTHALTLDPYIYMDESTGRLFDIDLTVACSYLSFSDDGGDSWTENPIACGRPINDHQTLFTGPPAISPTTVFPEVVYYCWNDFGTGTSCSKSIDGGVAWTVTGTRPFQGISNEGQGGPDVCGGFNGHGVVGPDGTVYLPKEHCGQPWLGISHDEGATWQAIKVATNSTEKLGSDTSVAVDKKGNLYYTWETADQQLFLATSTDGGEKWSDPMAVGAPGVEEVTLPSLEVGDPGKVAIAYVGTTKSPFKRCAENCTNEDYKETEWNGYITMSTNVLAKKPIFLSGSVNDPRDPFFRGRCDFNTRCGPLLDFLDIEIGPNGVPYAAFVDACIALCVQTGPHSNPGNGVVGSLVGGPKLR